MVLVVGGNGVIKSPSFDDRGTGWSQMNGLLYIHLFALSQVLFYKHISSYFLLNNICWGTSSRRYYLTNVEYPSFSILSDIFSLSVNNHNFWKLHFPKVQCIYSSWQLTVGVMFVFALWLHRIWGMITPVPGLSTNFQDLSWIGLNNIK